MIRINSNSTNQPAADFSNPLGLIDTCHDKLKQHCELLLKSAKHLQEHGTDNDFQTAIKQVQRYFSTAAKLHHRDEEEDIFPLVVRSSLKMTDLVHQLKETHRQLDAGWEALMASLEKDPLESNQQEFIKRANEFVDLNLQHLEHEEQDFFPIVKHMLSSDQLNKIGKSMAERRNVAL